MSDISILSRTPPGRLGLQRLALRVLIASVVVSAAMGVFALLVGEFEETQAKLLGSSLSVSGAGIVAMACGFAWERGRLWLLPPAGVALGVAGFALIVTGMWAEIDVVPYWRLTGSLLVVAVAIMHASVLSPFGLAGGFRWVFAATYALNALLTALVVVAIWEEPEWSGYWRTLGTVAILLAAATIAIPVLRRLGEAAAPAREAAPSGATHCPRCGEPLAHEGDESCAECGARFRVELR